MNGGTRHRRRTECRTPNAKTNLNGPVITRRADIVIDSVPDTAGLHPAQIEALGIIRAHVRRGQWVPPAAAATLLELVDWYRHSDAT
jgi:hypothetical protein